LYHRFEDRDGDTAAGRATAERTALAVRVVVANPDRDRNVVGETHEPGVVLVVGRAGLAGDVWREAGDGAGGSTCQHALHHALELIEGGTIDRADRR